MLLAERNDRAVELHIDALAAELHGGRGGDHEAVSYHIDVTHAGARFLGRVLGGDSGDPGRIRANRDGADVVVLLLEGGVPRELGDGGLGDLVGRAAYRLRATHHIDDVPRAL